MTKQQALDNLLWAVWRCSEAGMPILVKVCLNGGPHVMIDMAGVDVRDGMMVVYEP